VTIGNRKFALLGRLLVKRNPDVAAALLSDFQSAYILPTETDISKVPDLFSSFCAVHQLSETDVIASKHDRQVIHSKRVFIGAIISLYHPTALGDPEMMQLTKTGIVYLLADMLGRRHSNISRMIYEVILNMKVYDSFRQEVVDATQKLTSYGKNQKQENN
jgi:hypothetical protein